MTSLSARHSPNPDRAAAERLSASIGVARVMCLCGVVYVHAWTGLPGAALAALNGSGQGMLRWGLMELLGRGAVPLLSVVSGWLVAASLARRPFSSFIGTKARTILAPMVLWNALSILLVSGAAYAGLIRAPVPSTWWWTLDELLCLASPNDINVQMSFLRDLFVCMLAAPLLVRLPRWALVGVALGALAWTLSGLYLFVLLRPPILFFFVAGILVRKTGSAVRLASRPLALSAAPYLVLCFVKIWLESYGRSHGVDHAALLAGVDMAMRFSTALFFWTLAWRIADTRLGDMLLRLEPYGFLMFCSHLLLMWLVAPLIGAVTGPMGSPLYPSLLVSLPALAMLAAVGLGKGLLAVSPTAANLLSGGRLAPDSVPGGGRAKSAPAAQTV